MFPIPSAMLVKIGIVVAIFLGGYFMGWNGEHKKFVQFKLEVAALGKAQEVLNKAKVREHEIISSSITSEYEARLAAVNHYYDGVLNARPSGLPSIPKPATGANASATDTVSARQCTETTLQLIELQRWITNVK